MTIKKFSNAIVPIENTSMLFTPRSDEDSSRVLVFCLEHDVEVEQQLRSISGVHMLLLCHPDYPKVEADAKLAAEELGFDHLWNVILFRDATKEDEEGIQACQVSEEAIPRNWDWAVKLGINLYYSATLSRSPLYSKQMPFNSVIYNAFGHGSPVNSATKPMVYEKGPSKQKKIAVAGKWCGKVWMSNQVHPLLLPKDPEEQEQEEDRSFHSWAKPDEKIDRKLESKAETTTATRKPGMKRKMGVDSELIKKAKCTEREDLVGASDDSVEDSPHRQDWRILRKKRMKQEMPKLRNKFEQNTKQYDPYVEDKLEGGPSMRLRERKPKPKIEFEAKLVVKKQISGKRVKKTPATKTPVGNNDAKVKDEG